MDGRCRDKKMKKKKEVEGVGEFKEGSARGQCRGRGGDKFIEDVGVRQGTLAEYGGES